jgi:hypothetical protein
VAKFLALGARGKRFREKKQPGDEVEDSLIADIATQGTQTVTQTGSLRSAIAVVCSWERNRSILWAIIHGTLSWFYVIYFALTRQPDEMKQKDKPNKTAGLNRYMKFLSPP